MSKKHLIYSFLFLASISLHSFADHHEHFDSKEEYASDCQACEENVEIQISKSQPSNVYIDSSSKTSLISRFVSFKTKSNLSRAPPS
jgi:hypothetical protein